MKPRGPFEKSVTAAALGFALAALHGLAWATDEQPTGRPKVIETQADCGAALLETKSTEVAKVIDVTTRCLAVRDQGIAVRSLLLRARAGAYGEQSNNVAAISDLEEAFRLVPPKTGWEIIELASIYYDAGRYGDAVALIQGGMRQEIGMTGRGSGFGMPLYYHLGRNLVALNRNEEAIEALSAGIPSQPDFAYAYWYRSLAYANLHDDVRAKADLEEFARWVDPAKLTTAERQRLGRFGVEAKVGTGRAVDSAAVLTAASRLRSTFPGSAPVKLAKITQTMRNDRFPTLGPMVLEIKPTADGNTRVHEVYGPDFNVDREIAGVVQLRSQMNARTAALSGGAVTQKLDVEVPAWAPGASFSYRSEAYAKGTPLLDGKTCTIGDPVEAKSFHASFAGRAWPLDCKDLKGGSSKGYYVEELNYFLVTHSESKDFGTTNNTIDSVVVER